MATASAGAEQKRRLKSWSRMGELGRTPTEYEFVTYGMIHTMKDLPLEAGENIFGNEWYRKYRGEKMAIQVDDWDAFRDPDQMFYRRYTRMQDEAETHIDHLLIEYEERRDIDHTFTAGWLDTLQHVWTPLRYPGHGLQMLSAYLYQMAPSSFIGNCATFQTGDELRLVQRIAERTKQLALAHPSRRFGAAEREIWERHEGWQACREAIEKLFTTYAWDEAFTALNLVVKPAIDELCLKQFANLARQNGDELDALIADNLYVDSERSRRWSTGFAKFAIERRAQNRQGFEGHVRKWKPLADAIRDRAASVFAQISPKPLDASKVASEVRVATDGLLATAGISV